MREGFSEVDDAEGGREGEVVGRCAERGDFCVFCGFFFLDGGGGGQIGGWRGLPTEETFEGVTGGVDSFGDGGVVVGN